MLAGNRLEVLDGYAALRDAPDQETANFQTAARHKLEPLHDKHSQPHDHVETELNS